MHSAILSTGSFKGVSLLEALSWFTLLLKCAAKIYDSLAGFCSVDPSAFTRHFGAVVAGFPIIFFATFQAFL